jgi:hypothetical protein
MTRLLLAALLTASAGTAAAQTVTITRESGETDTVQTAETSAPAPAPQSARNCMRHTGSRIVAAQNMRAEKEGKPQRCASGPGRVYSSEELDRTGHINLADALRSLDPSIR